MFLDYDCLRDVLIALERGLEISAGNGSRMEISFSSMSLSDLIQSEELSGYPPEDVFYAVYNLRQAGYISALIDHAGDAVYACVVTDITYAGHMFLRSIHDETIWTSVKKRLGPAINASLPVVSEVAAQLIFRSLKG